jgi:DNA modification methylase
MTQGTKMQHKYTVTPIEDLIPYANNSRTHSDEQVNQVASSIKEFGFTNPVLIDEQGGIIAGHGRIMAAKKLGIVEIPCIELVGLTEAQKKAYVIADNQLALNAGWNLDLLRLEIETVKELDFDINLLGFDDDFLGTLFDSEVKEGLTDEDDCPDTPDEPVTVTGDIWTLGRHRLMCGDSTSIDAVERLMDGKKADFCFTSPPYNAAIKSAQMHSSAPKAGVGGLYVGGYSDDRTSDEYIKFNSDIISTLSAVSAENFTCCYNINYNKNSPSEYIDVVHAAKQSIPLVETIVWEKAMAVSLQGDNLTRIYEFVFVLSKGKFKINKNRTECLKNLWKISNIGANHESHKACFPLALVEEGIKNFCPHGGTIVEPFGGTGTTMIAAEKMGCKSHLMELDPKYVDVIIKRWQDFTGQEAVHETTGDKFNDMPINGRVGEYGMAGVQ